MAPAACLSGHSSELLRVHTPHRALGLGPLLLPPSLLPRLPTCPSPPTQNETKQNWQNGTCHVRVSSASSLKCSWPAASSLNRGRVLSCVPLLGHFPLLKYNTHCDSSSCSASEPTASETQETPGQVNTCVDAWHEQECQCRESTTTARLSLQMKCIVARPGLSFPNRENQPKQA